MRIERWYDERQIGPAPTLNLSEGLCIQFIETAEEKAGREAQEHEHLIEKTLEFIRKEQEAVRKAEIVAEAARLRYEQSSPVSLSGDEPVYPSPLLKDKKECEDPAIEQTRPEMEGEDSAEVDKEGNVEEEVEVAQEVKKKGMATTALPDNDEFSVPDALKREEGDPTSGHLENDADTWMDVDGPMSSEMDSDMTIDSIQSIDTPVLTIHLVYSTPDIFQMDVDVFTVLPPSFLPHPSLPSASLPTTFSSRLANHNKEAVARIKAGFMPHVAGLDNESFEIWAAWVQEKDDGDIEMMDESAPPSLPPPEPFVWRKESMWLPRL